MKENFFFFNRCSSCFCDHFKPSDLLSVEFVQTSIATFVSFDKDNAVLDMLSPTRSSAQALLKNIVTTVAANLQDSASTSIEHHEESNDADDQEPSKKKFKDDPESEVRILTSLMNFPPRIRMCISGGDIRDHHPTSRTTTEET